MTRRDTLPFVVKRHPRSTPFVRWCVMDRRDDTIISEHYRRSRAKDVAVLSNSLVDHRRCKNVAPLVTTPERCPKCKEVLTPYVTRGNTKCRCDEPGFARSKTCKTCGSERHLYCGPTRTAEEW